MLNSNSHNRKAECGSHPFEPDSRQANSRSREFGHRDRVIADATGMELISP
jgi:hypothetical protein